MQGWVRVFDPPNHWGWRRMRRMLGEDWAQAEETNTKTWTGVKGRESELKFSFSCLLQH